MNATNALDLSNYHPLITVLIIIIVIVLCAIVWRIMRNHQPDPEMIEREESPLVKSYHHDYHRVQLPQPPSGMCGIELAESLLSDQFADYADHVEQDWNTNPDQDTPEVD